MKTLRYILLLSAIFVMASARCLAKVTDPNVYISEYNKIVAQSGKSTQSFDFLMNVFKEYYPLIENGNSDYSDRQVAVTGLKWMFPYLKEGAVFYSERNNPNRAREFAEAYVDIYTHPAMQPAQLQADAMYPNLTYFAASGCYNTKNYAKAIKYLDAYIRSGDTKNVKIAFDYIAKSYVKLGQIENAKTTLKSGLEFFPGDLSMLTTAINLLAESKSDDRLLQHYVTQALQLRPGEEALLNIQAQLYERTQNFDGAVTYYRKLKAKKPNNLEVARHLGVNLYNSAIRSIHAGESKNVATLKLQEAAKVLTDVMVSDPLAINYVYALANTYKILGDRENLDRTNARLVALGREPVAGDSANMDLIAVNNERVSPVSIPAYQQPQPAQPVYQSPVQQIAQQTGQGNRSSDAAQPARKSVSDVDLNIPTTGYRNQSAFAVIIANSDYEKVARVDNADNDGKIFSEYCRKVLGIPQDHIRTHYNTTYGELLDAIEDIKSIAKAKRGDLDVIFYYAGHGVPDDKTKTAYILPVDADGKQMRVCYPMKELYAELAALNAKSTTVFLDACFSGATRADGEMLMAARSVAIDVDPDEIEGNLVVFSAATGNQTAAGYDEQNHGMFTYFLLKKLKESKGNIDLATLADYVIDNVSLESQLKNKKQQTPTIVTGNGIEPQQLRTYKLIK